ncbi:hypothetical protein FUAX_42390 (plasmid) [Fulvitalea axinellae]|uniref:ABC transporter domain-containing protein n=1 Tax=Fulvitalea axinellae TaxID=1182444 RepID=A0AAU9CXU5_9BACT|nr:hypothetical protein FUAX_42390 [Fulvitalea axinellae]
MISVKNLSKNYGDTEALKSVSLEVSEGELFGLIGPDGAGKSTLFKIMVSLLLPDSGEASINGYDPVTQYRDVRQRIGYMPGKFSLYQDLSVEENLSFFASIFDTTIEENYDLVKDIYVQIEPFRKRRAGALSGGMKQKLALCCALIHKPEVLFLDEPTTGVDPVSRKEFWQMLKRLRAKGISVIVSTPYMDEAELCDRVALIKDGKILRVDTPAKIVESFSGDMLFAKNLRMYPLLKALRAYPEARSVFSFGERIHFVFKEQHSGEGKLAAYLAEAGLGDTELSEGKPGIEDCFMALSEG